MSETYDIHTLPEGTLLYEESSVRNVSQAIRAITGRDTLYSHTEQAEAILNLGNYIYPFFMLGKGSGGMGCNGSHGFWGNVNGKYQMGPIFPNLLYNFREHSKNLNIIFKISRSEMLPQRGTLDARLKVAGYIFYVEIVDDVSRIRIEDVGTYTYNDNDECKIVIDTYQKKLYMYVNDELVVDGLTINDVEFTERAEEVRTYFDFAFPSYAEDPGTGDGRGWHTCEIKYFRMEMEDWSNGNS